METRMDFSLLADCVYAEDFPDEHKIPNIPFVYFSVVYTEMEGSTISFLEMKALMSLTSLI